MKVHEVRDLSDQDLQTELVGSHKELMNLRFRVATKQLANTAQLRTVKKNIARLNTIIRERQLGES